MKGSMTEKNTVHQNVNEDSNKLIKNNKRLSSTLYLAAGTWAWFAGRCGQGVSGSAAQSCDSDLACCYCPQDWQTTGSTEENTSTQHTNATHSGRPTGLAYLSANSLKNPSGYDNESICIKICCLNPCTVSCVLIKLLMYLFFFSLVFLSEQMFTKVY